MKQIEQSGRDLKDDLPKNLVPKQIVRSKRRTIALILKDDGQLIVRAPLKCSDKKIEEFIFQKSDWITSKKRELKKNNLPPLKLNGKEETIPILGCVKNVLLTDCKNAKVDGDDLLVPVVDGKIKLKKFLVKLTKKEVTSKTQKFAEQFGFEYASITVRDSKTRWGSCGYKNSLNFSLRLALCPSNVVDYIILHELTHTIVKNHGKQFYKHLAKVMPNYLEAEEWLRVNKSIMNLV